MAHRFLIESSAEACSRPIRLGVVTETPYRTRARTPRKSPLKAGNSARYCNFASGSKVQRFHMAEITLGDDFAGCRVEDLGSDLPGGVQVTMVRKNGQNIVPTGDLALAPGDGV